MDSLPKSSNLKKFVKTSERTAGIQVSKPARKEVCLSWQPTMWWMTKVWIKEEIHCTQGIKCFLPTCFVKIHLQNIHILFKTPYLLHTFVSFNQYPKQDFSHFDQLACLKIEGNVVQFDNKNIFHINCNSRFSENFWFQIDLEHGCGAYFAYLCKCIPFTYPISEKGVNTYLSM